MKVCLRGSKNLKKYVAKLLSKGFILSKRADNTYERGYCPKLDVSPVLGPDKASYYQSITGVMRWMIEIGCIDINTKASLLSSHSAMPRQEHLNAVLHIMGYRKLRHNSGLSLTLPIPIKIIVIFGCEIRQISNRVQWKLSHLMHHCQEGKRWICE